MSAFATQGGHKEERRNTGQIFSFSFFLSLPDFNLIYKDFQYNVRICYAGPPQLPYGLLTSARWRRLIVLTPQTMLCSKAVCKTVYLWNQKVLYRFPKFRQIVKGTSRSAIAEKPRNACYTSNRKPVKIAFVRWKSVGVSDFWRGWVTSISHFRWKGTLPSNHCWVA